MSDIEIIRQIEKLLSINLPERGPNKKSFSSHGYANNESGRVTHLSLSGHLYEQDPNFKAAVSLLSQLSHLTSLNLSENGLSSASFLSQLYQIANLDLSNNKISDISPLGQLSHLTSLGLAGNQISDISHLGNLSQLTDLHLAVNQICDVSCLSTLPQLTDLHLEANQIHDISPLSNLSRLTSLDFSHNQVSNIFSLNNLTRLTSLNLSNNQISNVSCLNKLSQLTYLNLSNNQISDISCLNELSQLTLLNLSNNQISDISCLSGLTRLTDLRLSENHIETVPIKLLALKRPISLGIYDLPNEINLRNNPINMPPIEIVEQGNDAIQEYYEAIEKEETVRVDEVKLILVGDGGAGKTSLLKQLQGEPYSEHESQTHGVNVVTVEARNIPNLAHLPSLSGCRLHCWDFGGQEVMHASHQFFLSKRALYIFVLDSRSDSRKFYWLKHIEKFSGDSPVIVAINKTDSNPSYSLERQTLNASYPAIQNRFHRISCQTGAGLPDLFAMIGQAVLATELFGSEVPKSWMAVKDDLVTATKAKHYVSEAAFLAICQKHQVTAEKTLLTFLHQIGTVLYFEDIRLADIFVLDPHWVTIAVYKIINSAKIVAGRLHEADLNFVLNTEEVKTETEYAPVNQKQFTYSRPEQRYILEIMHKFELAYRLTEAVHIVPDLLPKDFDGDQRFDEENAIHFIMEYDYLPTSVFSRLMVALKDHIIPDRQWYFGVFLQDLNPHSGCHARILRDEQAQRIKISVQGEAGKKRDYFSFIYRHLFGINRKFENMKVTEWIPLPGYPGHEVEYAVLRGHEAENIPAYFDGKLRKSFPVSALLDAIISPQNRPAGQPGQAVEVGSVGQDFIAQDKLGGNKYVSSGDINIYNSNPPDS